jgi:septum formation inhibitor MinC
MKTDLNSFKNSLKKEVSRLADVDYLKKEINRLTSDIKNSDVSITLTPQAKETLNQIEDRVRHVLQRLSIWQKEVDARIDKLMKMVGRPTGKAARKTTKKSAGASKTSKKKSPSRATSPTRKKATRTAKKKSTR